MDVKHDIFLETFHERKGWLNVLEQERDKPATSSKVDNQFFTKSVLHYTMREEIVQTNQSSIERKEICHTDGLN